MTTPTNEEAMREQFEAWMREHGAYPQAVERNGFGEYRLMTTYTNWVAWQTALRSPAVVALVEAGKNVVAAHEQSMCSEDKRAARLDLKSYLAPFTTGAGHE